MSTPGRHRNLESEYDFRRPGSNASDVISSNGISGPQEAKAALACLTPKALTSFSGRKQEEEAQFAPPSATSQQMGRLETPESKSRRDCLESKESCNNSPSWSLEAAESKLNTVKRIQMNSLAIFTLTGRKKH